MLSLATHLLAVEILGAHLHLLSFSLATTLLILGKVGGTGAVSDCFLLLLLHLRGGGDMDSGREFLALDVSGNQLQRRQG